MKKILKVSVGTPVVDNIERVRTTTSALQAGKSVTPHYAVGFESLSQLLAVFTPKRLELIALLRERGPASIAELARMLRRDYKNVHGDVKALIEWLAVERNDAGLVFVPWDEIDFKVPLTRLAA